MRSPHRSALLGTFAVLLGLPMAAPGRDGIDFRYDASSTILPDQVYAVWNPRDRRPLFAPGMKIMFFGQAAACQGGGADGGMVHPAGQDWNSKAASLTGIRPGAPNLAWVPSGDATGCPASARGSTADSFAFANPGQGVGLYVSAGPTGASGAGASPFFGVYGSDGQNGSGANRGIDGTFFGVRFPLAGPGAAHPFAGGAALRLQARLGVASFRASGGTETQPVQADQHVAVTLLNEACAAAPRHLCQFKYLFHTALYRSGVDDWSKVAWFKEANLFVDGAQGGTPVIQGPLAAAGQPVFGRGVGVPVYRSFGAPTQHQQFGGSDFDVRIDFGEVRNALRMIVAGKDHAASTDPAVAAAFGARWQDPATWVLVDLNIGQEVANHTSSELAYLGGSVQRLVLTSETAR